MTSVNLSAVSRVARASRRPTVVIVNARSFISIRVITMVSKQDRDQLDHAAEILLDVIARHRGEDLRALTVLNEAIQDIRVGARYLAACAHPPAQGV